MEGGKLKSNEKKFSELNFIQLMFSDLYVVYYYNSNGRIPTKLALFDSEYLANLYKKLREELNPNPKVCMEICTLDNFIGLHIGRR